MSAEVRSLSLPEPAALARAIAARLPAFRDISWVGSTGSTNADLLARARAGGGRGRACSARTCRKPDAAAPAAPGKTGWARP
ncbi:biotin protein ligase [Bordetella pertussis]|nr:biotin protein ligase [Bordetella pertussis]